MSRDDNFTLSSVSSTQSLTFTGVNRVPLTKRVGTGSILHSAQGNLVNSKRFNNRREVGQGGYLEFNGN